MKNKRPAIFAVLFLLLLYAPAFAAPLYSPTWGFSLDLPEGYVFVAGDNTARFSFANDNGARFDIAVYPEFSGGNAPIDGPEELIRDVERKLNNSGGLDSFLYRGKKVFVLELSFSFMEERGAELPMSGWALCMELGESKENQRNAENDGAFNRGGSGQKPPLFLAMAYGPSSRGDLQAFHLSALDSLVPEESYRYFPGPITEYAYPREARTLFPLAGLNSGAFFYNEDAEAAQSVVDREFQVLRSFVDSPLWQEAWARFYRAIYRDSFDRLADAAFQVEREMNVPLPEILPGESGMKAENIPGPRDFADRVLDWVQNFKYERDLLGSDFVNLVSAATEGRGDCDSRAMLWALVLHQANISSAIMVSRHYSHAMGLADLPGEGARFEVEGRKLLVAETTDKVPTGLIGETVSDIEYWLGILFE